MKNGKFEWDIKKIASALKIESDDIKEYFKDKRRISFLLGRRIAKEVLGGRLAPSEGAGYDFLDKNGGK